MRIPLATCSGQPASEFTCASKWDGEYKPIRKVICRSQVSRPGYRADYF
jgi:hypothetical protein